MKKNLSHYQEFDLTTASPGLILLKLYEGLIAFLHQAKKALQQKDHSQKSLYTSKSLGILTELLASLKEDQNNNLTQQLTDLYLYIMDRISEGNIQNQEAYYTEAITLLEPLKKAWEDVVLHPREDGIPSERLQPEEYAQYLKSKKDLKNKS